MLYYNQDCTDFFYSWKIGDTDGGAVLDGFVDLVADAGATHFLCNTNAQLVNYDSDVWQTFWDGFDPEGPDDQPLLAGVPVALGPDAVAGWRRLITGMMALHQQGVDYPDRVVRRCRHRDMSPWISLRMNDVHNNETPDHPIHSRFWHDHLELYRRGYDGYFATAFDYTHPEVRDHYLRLIEETLVRYDLDGLELDFQREPYLFSRGEEERGRGVLTEWIGLVRGEVEGHAARRGHAIQLGVRVPAQPEAALAMGLDPVSWARRGLIDLLVVTPRWSTLDYDMPLTTWREQLADSDTALLGGLEILSASSPAATKHVVTPEEARGAAAQVLHSGADGVYLFNYFPSPTPVEGTGSWQHDAYQQTLHSLASLDRIAVLPRRHTITFTDITGPEGADLFPPSLPATGTAVALELPTGPAAPSGSRAELSVCLSSPAPGADAFVNDAQLGAADGILQEDAVRRLVYRFAADSLDHDGPNRIRLVSQDGKQLVIEALSIDVIPPPA